MQTQCIRLIIPTDDLIPLGGVLTMKAFQDSFNLDKGSPHFSNLQGNIVSVLQVGAIDPLAQAAH